MSDEQVSPPNDYCSRCKRTGFELFFIEYKPGYGDGSIIANSVCRDCREQMRHIVASNITLTAVPAREDGVRELRAWIQAAVPIVRVQAQQHPIWHDRDENEQDPMGAHKLLKQAQALAAPAPACKTCGGYGVLVDGSGLFQGGGPKDVPCPDCAKGERHG